ncbi:MAG: transglutaminase-like domain-containing protein [Gemmataceae bacterium]|nr:transglutaminase-like domain-containing protein [Gemmataceae bacterium]
MLAWQELVEATDAELATRDIAETHLACAVGLPGAEGLDIPGCLRGVDSFALQVDRTTNRLMPNFRHHPERFKSSEAIFRMLCLVTVLQRDLGVYGDEKLNGDNPDCSNSQDLFLHGILDRKGGSCSSLPVLYTAVARRLGYPLTLVQTAHHLFARWDGCERFNVECTVPGLDTPPDEYYLTWPALVVPEEAQAGSWFQSMSPRQELAGFLIQRAYCLLHNNRHKEAVESCIGARVAAPENKLHERTTERLMLAWQAKLRPLLPPAFSEAID